MTRKPTVLAGVSIALFISLAIPGARAQPRQDASALDKKVQAFLDRRAGTWQDMNVPDADGRRLHELILEHGYKRALEIGTSTGHSGIWIAWALSKTGGKLVTVEIDEQRHKTALANFEEAGLSDYIDARLGNAHEIVPKLEGPFDFVFSDADKEWYTKYLIAVLPKVSVGGCFTAHNVSQPMSGIAEFLDYLNEAPNLDTTIDRSSSSGLSISYKRREG
ncbi:MAG: O-methyltransferase [Vicinamibacteraceae bacterium]